MVLAQWRATLCQITLLACLQNDAGCSYFHKLIFSDLSLSNCRKLECVCVTALFWFSVESYHITSLWWWWTEITIIMWLLPADVTSISCHWLTHMTGSCCRQSFMITCDKLQWLTVRALRYYQRSWPLMVQFIILGLSTFLKLSQ